MITSSLVKGLARVDPEGKVTFPRNILTAMGLKEKDIIELKIVRSSKEKRVLVSKHKFGKCL